MALTAGVLSQGTLSSTSVVIISTAASGGTGPYTEQLYMSTTSGFTPGGGNIITGATSLTNTVTGLVPNTQYYFKMVYTDTGNGNATITSAQLAVVTSVSTLGQNQFSQSPFLGTIDLRFDYDTVSGIIDVTQPSSTLLYAGAAVKLVPSSSPNSAPKLIGCTANADNVFGFINFDIKTVSYSAGSVCEVSQGGNVMYLYSTGAITQGLQVTLDVTTQGGVAQAVGSSGSRIVGWAYDGAAAAGTLIRVKLTTPSFLVA